jgi:hypothetical protein
MRIALIADSTICNRLYSPDRNKCPLSVAFKNFSGSHVREHGLPKGQCRKAGSNKVFGDLLRRVRFKTINFKIPLEDSRSR